VPPDVADFAPATPENFDERSYLYGNADAAEAVRRGRVASGALRRQLKRALAAPLPL
jgi:hypothetical protein